MDRPDKEVANKYIFDLESKGFVAKQIESGSYDNVPHLLWMLKEIVNNKNMTVEKCNRWLGFVQCALIVKGYYTINNEKDSTREIFNGK